MKKYNRIFVIVLDSLGIGAMPDSEKFGDVGVDTFGHILDQMGTLEIPNLKKLGMLNLHCGGNMEKAAEPMGRYARLGEASNGKDTMGYDGNQDGETIYHLYGTWFSAGTHRRTGKALR